MNNIILLAAPAGGKGTISKYISDKYKYEHISIGDLFRSEVNNNTDIGKKIASKMQKGLLIDDDIMFDVLRNRLINQNKDFIIDGVPRTLSQAKGYDKLLKELNINLERVIYISVDKEVALSRIKSRRICNKCGRVYNIDKDEINENKCLKCNSELSIRDDDNEVTFEKRYELFKNEADFLLEYYKDKVCEVKNNTKRRDAYKQIDDIFMKGDNIQW